MKKLLCLILVVFMMIPLVSCSKEEFEIVSCGSGFYFNRSNKKEYKIKELDAVSEGNYFYLEDYFCSEEYGQEYKIKQGLFTVGSVYLAEKSVHYNSETFRFNVADYNNNIIAITPEMNYVHLYSSSPETPVNIQVQIMDGRSTPIDLVLDGVNVVSEKSLPIIFSAASTDINMILCGENKLHVSPQYYTLTELLETIKEQHWSDLEASYYSALNELNKGLDASDSGNNGDAMEHFFAGISELGMGLADAIVDSASGLIDGVDGVTGADGGISVILHSGLSVSGEGTLSVKGGNGARGGAASGSLLGRADGGDGGKGGDGIYCGAYLDVSGRVHSEGGIGGEGGEATSGFFGSSGSNGKKGNNGAPVNAANPRQTED